MTGECIVYLKDGRRIDISDMTAEEAVGTLRALGVTTDEIEQTVHGRTPTLAELRARRSAQP